MAKIAVVTDSNSGIVREEAESLGVHLIPMPFFIDDEVFFEGINLSHEQFYDKLKNEHDIKTSQPSPEDVMKTWDDALRDNDSVVYIPMSSGLSSSWQTAHMLAEDYDGRVEVVNNQRISVTQRRSVLDALNLARAGKSAAEIREILERTKFDSSIFITLDTLKYLKRGGRITPAAAAIGTVLNLKPVLEIRGEKLDACAKVRGKAAALNTMIGAMKKELEEKYAGSSLAELDIEVAYSEFGDEASEWKVRVEEEFGVECYHAPLSLSVACHIGPGALAITCTKKLKI